MIDIVGLYEGLLLQATYRGLGFWMIDSRDEAGRSIERFLFPGRDTSEFQDLGQSDGAIAVTGLYLGDDYMEMANRLRSAFQTPGPATLVHPWLGELQVIQAPGRLPSFSFRHDELRVVRFSATFYRYYPRQAPVPDTLTALLNAAQDLRTQATALLATALAPAAVTLSAVGYVERFAASIATTWQALVGNAREPQVAASAAAPIAALNTINAVPVDAAYPATIAARLGAVSAAIAGTSTPVRPAAVAPGAATTTSTAVDGRITGGLMLSALSTMAAKGSDGAPGPTIAGVSQMLALADAVSAISSIDFTSQQEAAQWQTRLNSALDTAAAQTATLSATWPTVAGIAWRSLTGAKAALSADMTAAIGRLPGVVRFTSPGAVPVWLLAQYLAGDRPDLVQPVYLDLVTRNDIAHPATAPGGTLEVLAMPGLTVPVPQQATPPAASSAPVTPTAALGQFVLGRNVLA